MIIESLSEFQFDSFLVQQTDDDLTLIEAKLFSEMSLEQFNLLKTSVSVPSLDPQRVSFQDFSVIVIIVMVLDLRSILCLD
jgi:hypothetical protein